MGSDHPATWHDANDPRCSGLKPGYFHPEPIQAQTGTFDAAFCSVSIATVLAPVLFEMGGAIQSDDTGSV